VDGPDNLAEWLERNCGLMVCLKMENPSHPLIAHHGCKNSDSASRQADTVILAESAMILHPHHRDECTDVRDENQAGLWVRRGEFESNGRTERMLSP
jgi:hypothetical protein